MRVGRRSESRLGPTPAGRRRIHAADRYPDLLRGLNGLPNVLLVTFFGLADQPPTVAWSTATTYSRASI